MENWRLCWEHLLTLPVPLATGSPDLKTFLAADTAMTDLNIGLAAVELRLTAHGLAIPAHSVTLAKHFADTVWGNTVWFGALKQAPRELILTDLGNRQKVKIAGTTRHCIFASTELLKGLDLNAKPVPDIEAGGTTAGVGATGEGGTGLAGAAVSEAGVGADLSKADPAAPAPPVASLDVAGAAQPAAGSTGPAAPAEPQGDAEAQPAAAAPASVAAPQADAETERTFEAGLFTKRSVTIAAMPTDGTPESNRAVIDWTRDSATPAFMDKNAASNEQLSINTLEGAHWVTPGDWIVRGIKGEHYPVKPDIFDALYDQAQPAANDKGEELTFRSPLDIAELARGVGAAARFFADGAVGEPDMFDREEAAIMADFVRANPDAPVLAMFNQLTLVKRYDRTEPNLADVFVLTLFHAACTAAFKFHLAQEAEKAGMASRSSPASTWPGEQAFKPQEAGFAATGFSPR